MSFDEFEENLITLENREDLPDFQQFIALNIFVVGNDNRRQRVTITNSLKVLATELSHVLPNNMLRMLRYSEETISYKDSSHELPMDLVTGEPYIAVCSCGSVSCEHVEIAYRHFKMIQSFANNTGAILEELRQRKQQIDEDQAQLQRLKTEHTRLERRLEDEEETGIHADELKHELSEKEAELDRLREQIELSKEQRKELENKLEVHQQNYKDIAEAVATQSDSNSFSNRTLDDATRKIINNDFLPSESKRAPEDKLELNVTSDHHKSRHSETIAARAARLWFIHEVGIGRRLSTKMGKVQILPGIGELKLIVPHQSDANIIRVYSTAETMQQHYFSAHLLADQFDVQVQTD